MAPRSKPRASKKKVASRSAAEMVLREEILGRVFDFLLVEDITDSIAVCKQFDAALPRVTCLSTRDEAFQRASGLVVWQRVSNVKHVKFDVHDMDLACFFTNVVRGGKELVSARLRLYRTPYLENDEHQENLDEFGRDLLGFARALKRGYLPNLDHFTMTFGSASMTREYGDLMPALDNLYRALPARAAVAAVICDTGNSISLRHILDNNDLDINAADSLGHTPLSLWCWNQYLSADDVPIASVFNELVSRGADVNQLSLDGFSPCAMVAACGHKTDSKLRLLLEAGASVSVGRHPPLPLLCRHEHLIVQDTCNSIAFKLLLKHGVDVTATSPEGETAMQLLTKHLEQAQDYVKRRPNLSDDCWRKLIIPVLQSMLIALGHAAHKMLESALVENNSLKEAGKRAAAAEPKTATRAKRKSRK
mmetsp:Transcript_16432/g.53556  ORF Transcript_16432/g.53556 Transcript_16432/m.53556 type:complete len:421 (-) Transcript_16432:55-1317(-)